MPTLMVYSQRQIEVFLRARMWLGERAPHGVFMESAEYTYQGNQVDLDSLDPRVFSILAGGVG